MEDGPAATQGLVLSGQARGGLYFSVWTQCYCAWTRQNLTWLVGKGSGTTCGSIVSVTDVTVCQLVDASESTSCTWCRCPTSPWMVSSTLVAVRASASSGRLGSGLCGSSLKSGIPLWLTSLVSSIDSPQVR